MNRERAKKLLPVIQAFAEGKAIEWRESFDSCIGRWEPITTEVCWNNSNEYRIKPEPKWRPWTEAECPRVAVLLSRDGTLCIGRYLDNSDMARVTGPNGFAFDYSRGSLLDNWRHIHEDGTEHPCGILEQE